MKDKLYFLRDTLYNIAELIGNIMVSQVKMKAIFSDFDGTFYDKDYDKNNSKVLPGNKHLC